MSKQMDLKAREKLRDRICYVILKAPDRFPSDTDMTLEKAFAEMYKNLNECFSHESEEFEKIRRLLNKAHEKYLASEQKQAIKQLQIIEGYLAGRTNELPNYS